MPTTTRCSESTEIETPALLSFLSGTGLHVGLGT